MLGGGEAVGVDGGDQSTGRFWLERQRPFSKIFAIHSTVEAFTSDGRKPPINKPPYLRRYDQRVSLCERQAIWKMAGKKAAQTQ